MISTFTPADQLAIEEMRNLLRMNAANLTAQGRKEAVAEQNRFLAAIQHLETDRTRLLTEVGTLRTFKADVDSACDTIGYYKP